jgi:hypothetical protein
MEKDVEIMGAQKMSLSYGW